MWYVQLFHLIVTQYQFTTSVVLLTESCASFSKLKRQLYFDLDKKNELLEKQWKTIQALKQEIKPRVEKRDIGVQFNFLVPVSGITFDPYHAVL